MLFATQYFPIIFGLFLSMLISVVRYFLTLKSAKNIQVSKTKVTGLTLAIFFILASTSLAWWAIQLMFDIPYSILVESCFSQAREPRPLTLKGRVVLNYPYIFILVSLTLDVLLLRFLQKTILPTSGQNLPTISGKLIHSCKSKLLLILTH